MNENQIIIIAINDTTIWGDLVERASRVQSQSLPQGSIPTRGPLLSLSLDSPFCPSLAASIKERFKSPKNNL